MTARRPAAGDDPAGGRPVAPPVRAGRGPPPRRGRNAVAGGAAEHGLTLLEMLIVLAVIAVAAGATAVSLGPRRDDAAGGAARQLAAAIDVAADRSIATGAAAVLVVDGAGYRLGGPRRRLPAGVTLRRAGVALPAAGVALPAAGVALPAAGGLPAAGAALPVAVDDPPFALIVADDRDRWRIAFDGWRAAAVRDPA